MYLTRFEKELLLSLFLSLLPPESLAEDITEPQLVEWQILTNEVDTSGTSATVRVEFRITDNDSGVKTPNVTANSTTTDQSSDGFAAVSLISGDRNDGVWSAAISIPKGSASGVWEVVLFPLEDNQGNSGSFGPPSKFNNTFKVKNDKPQDTEEPQLVEWQVLTNEVDTSGTSATVRVEFWITDNDSGVKTPNVTANSTTTDQSSDGFAAVSLISGDRNDGVWSAAISIPKGSASGVWEVVLFPLEDNQGNSGSFGPPSRFNNTFTVATANLNIDTDGDGYTDQYEAEMGSDPNEAGDIPRSGGLSPALLRLISEKATKEQ